MPRCGSTLIESILSVNPYITGLGETASLLRVIDYLASDESACSSQTIDIDSIYLGDKQVDTNSIILDKNLYNFAFLSWLPCVMPEKSDPCQETSARLLVVHLQGTFASGGAGYSSSLLDSARLLIEQEAQMITHKSVKSCQFTPFNMTN